jgi:hypothetical protein
MSPGQNQGEKKGRGLQVIFNIQVGAHQHITSPIENHQMRGNGNYGADKRICSNPNSGSFAREKREYRGLPSTKGDNDLTISELVAGRREHVVPSTMPLEDEDRQSGGNHLAQWSGRPVSRMFRRSMFSRHSSGNTYYTDERSHSLHNGESTLCSRFRSLFGSWKENHLEGIHEPYSQPRENVEMIPERRRQTYVFEAPPAPTGAPQAKKQVEMVQEDEAKSKGKTCHENCTCKKGKTYHEVCTCPSVSPILTSLIKQISLTNKLKPSCKCDEAFTALLLQDRRESELRRLRELEQRVDGEEFPIA